jgi:hypothetical protein
MENLVETGNSRPGVTYSSAANNRAVTCCRQGFRYSWAKIQSICNVNVMFGLILTISVINFALICVVAKSAVESGNAVTEIKSDVKNTLIRVDAKINNITGSVGTAIIFNQMYMQRAFSSMNNTLVTILADTVEEVNDGLETLDRLKVILDIVNNISNEVNITLDDIRMFTKGLWKKRDLMDRLMLIR